MEHNFVIGDVFPGTKEMDRRTLLLSKWIFLIPATVFLSINFLCTSIRAYGFLMELSGLLFDVGGAMIAVSPDTRWKWLWQQQRTRERVKSLRSARTHVSNRSGLAETDQPEFGDLLRVLRQHRTFSERPNRLILASSPDGIWLSATRNGTAIDVRGHEEPPEGENWVAKQHEVDTWLQEELDRVEQRDKEPIRRRGLEFLIVGFLFQIVGHLITNATLLPDLIVGMSVC